MSFQLPKVITEHYIHIGVGRGFLMGSSLAYAIEKEKYLEVPILFLFPTAYSGYYAYKNKEHIIKYISNIKLQRSSWPF